MFSLLAFVELAPQPVTAVGPAMSNKGRHIGSGVRATPNTNEVHMKISTPVLAAGAAALAFAVGVNDASAQGLPAGAASQAGNSVPVVVIVRVAKPWYAPKTVVVGKMRDTIPEYARLPGLMFKAFSFERESGDFGGLYYWRDRSSVDAWFNSAWFERVRKERGVEPLVRMFEAPVTVDNTAGGTLADSDSKAVGTLVEIPVPAGVTRERLVAEFKAAVPTYQKVPGLLRKHFTVSSNGSFGGVYLWKDEASARAWFGDAWHARVVKTYGQDAKMEWFETPILLPTQDTANIAAVKTLVVTSP